MLLADIAALAESDHNVAFAQQQRDLAQEQLTAADNALVLVTARRAALHDTVTKLRAGLSTFSRVPSDVLSIILEDVCRERNPSLLGLQTDWLAGLAPYRLAAVCRHWRSTALATPAMWTYIGLAKMYNNYEPAVRKYCGHLSTLLARSRACSLEVDLVLLASTCAHSDGATQYLSERFIGRVFALLVPNAARIRALTVCQLQGMASQTTPPHAGYRDGLLQSTLELLCCPTPMLTELRLDIGRDWDLGVMPPTPDLGFWKNYPTQPFPTFLPHAPRLKRLTVGDAPLLFERSHPGLPALRQLEFTAREVHTSLLYDTFVTAPNLDDIFICVDRYLDLGGANPQPAAPLRMSHMRFDRSSESSPPVLASPVVQLPNLTTLDLCDGLLNDIHGHVLASLARTLTTLVYRSDVRNAEDVAVLRQFVSLTSMTLNGEDFGGEDYRSRDHFFDALCDENDLMWPLLRQFTLVRRVSFGPLEDGLLRFVQARNQRPPRIAADGESPSLPLPLARVEFDSASIPPWVAFRVKAVLGDKCVQPW